MRKAGSQRQCQALQDAHCVMLCKQIYYLGNYVQSQSHACFIHVQSLGASIDFMLLPNSTHFSKTVPSLP